MLLTLRGSGQLEAVSKHRDDKVQNHFTRCSDGGRRARLHQSKKSHSARCFAVVRCHAGAPLLRTWPATTRPAQFVRLFELYALLRAASPLRYTNGMCGSLVPLGRSSPIPLRLRSLVSFFWAPVPCCHRNCLCLLGNYPSALFLRPRTGFPWSAWGSTSCTMSFRAVSRRHWQTRGNRRTALRSSPTNSCSCFLGCSSYALWLHMLSRYGHPNGRSVSFSQWLPR